MLGFVLLIDKRDVLWYGYRNNCDYDKAKLFARRGRKATGLGVKKAGLPKGCISAARLYIYRDKGNYY